MARPDDPLENNLYTLPPRDDLSVGEMLSQCANEVATGFLESGIVVGLDRNGGLLIRSSKMSRKDALWLLELARQHVIGK